MPRGVYARAGDSNKGVGYEQPPLNEKSDVSPDIKRIYVERKPTERPMDCQIPKFKRMGYTENQAYSDSEMVAMDIPMSLYEERAKARESKTTAALLASSSSGIEGEIINTTVQNRQTPEQFFDGPDPDSE